MAMNPPLFLPLLALGFFAAPSEGAISVLISPQGDNQVIVSYSGTINLDATLGFQGAASNVSIGMIPGAGAVQLGSPDPTSDYLIDISSWTPFGLYVNADRTSPVITTGDRFAMFVGPSLGVPQGYASGTPLSGSSVFAETYESLGLTPGSYVSIIDSGTATETFTVTVAPVPEPSASILGIISLSALFGRRRR